MSLQRNLFQPPMRYINAIKAVEAGIEKNITLVNAVFSAIFAKHPTSNIYHSLWRKVKKILENIDTHDEKLSIKTRTKLNRLFAGLLRENSVHELISAILAIFKIWATQKLILKKMLAIDISPASIEFLREDLSVVFSEVVSDFVETAALDNKLKQQHRQQIINAADDVAKMKDDLQPHLASKKKAIVDGMKPTHAVIDEMAVGIDQSIQQFMVFLDKANFDERIAHYQRLYQKLLSLYQPNISRYEFYTLKLALLQRYMSITKDLNAASEYRKRIDIENYYQKIDSIISRCEDAGRRDYAEVYQKYRLPDVLLNEMPAIVAIKEEQRRLLDFTRSLTKAISLLQEEIERLKESMGLYSLIPADALNTLRSLEGQLFSEFKKMHDKKSSPISVVISLCRQQNEDRDQFNDAIKMLENMLEVSGGKVPHAEKMDVVVFEIADDEKARDVADLELLLTSHIEAHVDNTIQAYTEYVAVLKALAENPLNELVAARKRYVMHVRDLEHQAYSGIIAREYGVVIERLTHLKNNLNHLDDRSDLRHWQSELGQHPKQLRYPGKSLSAFGRYFIDIIGTTLGFAAAGAIAGGVVGCVTAVFTLGLGIAIFAVVGVVVGALVGFLASTAVALLVNLIRTKQPEPDNQAQLQMSTTATSMQRMRVSSLPARGKTGSPLPLAREGEPVHGHPLPLARESQSVGTLFHSRESGSQSVGSTTSHAGQRLHNV